MTVIVPVIVPVIVHNQHGYLSKKEGTCQEGRGISWCLKRSEPGYIRIISKIRGFCAEFSSFSRYNFTVNNLLTNHCEVVIMLSLSGTITYTSDISTLRPRVNTNKRSTIKQVAKAAGVSTQTVSRVINDRPDVAPQTRARVHQVIDELGYQPSALARSLIRQRSETLGVVTAGLKYIGPSRTLSGITGAAEDAGYAILLKELPRFEADNIAPIFQALLARHVDGIIWAVPEIGKNHSWVNELLLDLDIPIVYITMEAQQNISVVSINNYLGGRMAMSHLLECGYRRIAHISGPLDWWESRQRMAAWRDALSEAGLDCRDEYSVEGNWSSASGSVAIEKLLKQYPGLDSIFVGNDQMALSVMQYACQNGLRIPGEIGVVGFDNIQESAFFWPPLTTIQQDQYQVGKLAVEEMIKIIETGWQGLEPNESKSILLSPTLVVRQSTLRLADLVSMK
jgi:LacI family transcriptional regulator